MSKTITLPSGKSAVIGEFKGRHIREAQKVSGDDTSKVLFAIIATIVEIDGKPVVMEDIDDMNGMDVMTLMGEFGTNFTSRQNN